ncbi:hypothetical protein ACJX0J_022981, partial [Zea mays]
TVIQMMHRLIFWKCQRNIIPKIQETNLWQKKMIMSGMNIIGTTKTTLRLWDLRDLKPDHHGLGKEKNSNKLIPYNNNYKNGWDKGIGEYGWFGLGLGNYLHLDILYPSEIIHVFGSRLYMKRDMFDQLQKKRKKKAPVGLWKQQRTGGGIESGFDLAPRHLDVVLVSFWFLENDKNLT